MQLNGLCARTQMLGGKPRWRHERCWTSLLVSGHVTHRDAVRVDSALVPSGSRTVCVYWKERKGQVESAEKLGGVEENQVSESSLFQFFLPI